MKALILAAGLGTRLRPWTDKVPKPLIPVAGVEPLFFALWKLQKSGIKQVCVNAHHLAGQISEALCLFSSLLPELKLSYSLEKDQILGTGGSILKIIEEGFVKDEALVVLNGDTLAHIDLSKIISSKNSQMALSFNQNYLSRYQPLWVSHDGVWLKDSQKLSLVQKKPAHFLGVHSLSAQSVSFIASKKIKPREANLFEAIYEPLSQGGIKVCSQEFIKTEDEFWIDLNQKQYFEEARGMIEKSFSLLWREILTLRHPKLSIEKAKEYWPL
jgi:NDP-sugar pyrophosphorylase family protein